MHVKRISSAGIVPKYSIWKDWKDVYFEESKAFLGVIINLTLNPKPELKEYFSNDFLKKMPFFPHIFQRKRFLQIFWMLQVAPSPDASSGRPTRRSKVTDVVAYIDAKCREHFNAGPKICMDESTVGFSGRESHSSVGIRRSQQNGACTLMHSFTAEQATFLPLSHTTKQHNW